MSDYVSTCVRVCVCEQVDVNFLCADHPHSSSGELVRSKCVLKMIPMLQFLPLAMRPLKLEY